MATLEKIRSKSVLLFIVIIFALLAFILGDFIRSGRSATGSGTTMYKVGNVKIDQSEYKHAYDAQQESYKQQQERQQRVFDAAQFEQDMLQRLALEALLQEQYNQLGINVTDAEITNVMMTSNPLSSQFYSQVAQALGLPYIDGPQLLDIIQNPSRSPYPPEAVAQLEQLWKNQEAQVESQLKQQAFNSLISGLFTANKVDAMAQYNDNMERLVLNYVALPVGVAGEDVEVSDADIRNVWENDKWAYYQPEPSKVVKFIAINIAPSPEDLAQARKEVDNLEAELNEKPGLEGMSNASSSFTQTTVSTFADKVSRTAGISQVPDSVATKEGAVYRIPYNPVTRTHALAKVLSVDNRVDSVNVSLYVAPNAAQLDSIKGLIAGGTSMDTIVAKNPQNALGDEWIQLNIANAYPNDQFRTFLANNLKDFLTTTPVGTPTEYVDTVSGINMLVAINKRNAPKQYVNIASISYEVVPSSTTESELWSSLNSFIASNPTAELFSTNATDTAYNFNPQSAIVAAAVPHLGNIEDSRKAIKWAMNNKVGKVSNVFRGRTMPRYLGAPTQDVYYAVAVMEDNKGEYLPYSSEVLKENIASRARSIKKGNDMVSQYQGKATDLNGYAQTMNAHVQNDSTYSFNSRAFGSLSGQQAQLRGAAASANPGQLVGPILGDNEVVVFMVSPVDYEHRDFNYASDGREFMSKFQFNNPFMLLKGDNKIKNNSLNFVVLDEE